LEFGIGSELDPGEGNGPAPPAELGAGDEPAVSALTGAILSGAFMSTAR